MRLLLTIIALISATLGLALSILPFQKIALIPIVLAFVLGFIVFKMTQKEGKNTKFVKVIFLVTIVALSLSIYRSIFDENIVENDVETINRDAQSEEDAVEELESIEIED